ncbi:MAG: MFS transporter [Phycisphaeraceae bacterium]|nr:MFS transporter [Phycisphaeraceae bacterium]
MTETASTGVKFSASPPAATRIVFFLSGVCVAAWAPLIPFVKDRFALSEGQLGLLLLCLGIGSIAAMPLAGALTGRLGCRRVIVVSLILAWCMLPLATVIGRVDVLAVALLLFGAGLGVVDVAMNIHAVLVERAAGRALMSGFHGLWSVGGIAGAGLTSLLISSGVSLLVTSLVVVGVSVLLLAACFRGLLESGGEHGPAFAWPHGRVVVLGICCFVLYLAEGSVLEWGAVFLSTVRGMNVAHAGVGFVAFASAMTMCRLIGDRVVHAIGPARVVLFGGLLAAAGFLVVVGTSSIWASIAGFVLVGIGASNIVPVMFSAAGRQTSMPAHLALPAMTTLGYAGGLIGPPVIGFVAQASSLSVSLGLIGVLMAAIAVASIKMRL